MLRLLPLGSDKPQLGRQGSNVERSEKRIMCPSSFDRCILIIINNYHSTEGGVLGVMVIVVGNGHGDTSSNPGRGRLHFT